MTLQRAIIVMIISVSAANVCGQQRIETGPFKGFVREEPMLMLTEIPNPFRVREIKGVLYYGDDSPLAEAFFEIRDSSGRVITAVTDKNGGFSIPSMKPGTYEFKATMNQFHSAIGKIIVSPSASRKKTIRLQMHIGT